MKKQDLAYIYIVFLGASGCAMLNNNNDGVHVLEYSLPMSVVELEVVEIKTTSNENTNSPPANVADATKTVIGAGADQAKSTAGSSILAKPGEKDAPSSPADQTASTNKAGYDLYYRLIDKPDSRHEYIVSYSASPFSDDKFSIGVDENGLLNMLNATPTERTPDFFKKIGELGVESLKAAAAFGATFEGGPSADKNKALHLQIDPSSCANKELPCTPIESSILKKYGYNVRFESLSKKTTSDSKAETCEGICFRGKHGIRMIIEEKEANDWIVRESLVIAVPNFSPILSLDVSRSIGVQRSQLATIQAGYLTKYDLTKNSEALALIQAPIDIAKLIGGIPLSLIGIEKDRATSLNDLYTAQQNLYKTQNSTDATKKTDEAKLQKDLYDAQKNMIDSQLELMKSQDQLKQMQSNK